MIKNFNRGVLSHFVNPRLGLRRVAEKTWFTYKHAENKERYWENYKIQPQTSPYLVHRAQIYPVVLGVQFAPEFKGKKL